MIAVLVAQLFVSPVSPVLSASPYMLYGASVDASSSFSTGSSASTDQNGMYVINSSIVPGQYSVTASDTGFLEQSTTAMINTTSDVDTLNFNLARSGIVWGRVIGFDGHPVVGAEVSLTNNGFGPSPSSVITDSNGMYYFFEGVDNGNYSAKVDFQFSFSLLATLLQFKANATDLNFPYPDAPYLANGYVGATSSAFLTTAGGVTQVPDVVLQQSGVITGQVTDGLGHGLANVPVSAQARSSHFSNIVLTD
jgi:hypothetical protein